MRTKEVLIVKRTIPTKTKSVTTALRLELRSRVDPKFWQSRRPEHDIARIGSEA